MPELTRETDNSGGMSCVRVTLIAFNLLTLLAGVATLSIGLLLFFSSRNGDSSMELLDDVARQQTFLPNQGEFRGFSIILIALGSLVGLVSFMGCFGACINSRCLLICYLISVGVILSLQFLVSVFSIIYRQPMNTVLRDQFLFDMKHQYRSDAPDSSTWGTIQQTFMCCGVDGYTDWFYVDAWPGEQYVPDSCCKDAFNSTGCGQKLTPNLWYKNGCLANVQFAILEKLHYLASAIITLVFLQLYGIIASTLLFYHIKDPKQSSSFQSYSYERAKLGRE